MIRLIRWLRRQLREWLAELTTDHRDAARRTEWLVPPPWERRRPRRKGRG